MSAFPDDPKRTTRKHFQSTTQPGRSDGKEPACNAGDLGSIHGLRRSLVGGNGNPFQYSWLKNSMDRESWQATAHGITESDTTEELTLIQSGPVNWPLGRPKDTICQDSITWPNMEPNMTTVIILCIHLSRYQCCEGQKASLVVLKKVLISLRKSRSQEASLETKVQNTLHAQLKHVNANVRALSGKIWGPETLDWDTSMGS